MLLSNVYQVRNKAMRLIAIIISTCLLFVSIASNAASIDELVANKQIVVSMKLTNQTDIIPNEPAIYDVEVLSASPFFDNMELSYVDVTNSVVVPPSENTKLDVRSIDGNDWFVQSKKVIIYPLQSGEFVVPNIAVKVSINVNNNEKIAGAVSTEKQTFLVTESPNELQGLEYLVSSNLELELRKKSPEQEKLEVGHAITQTYIIKGDDLHTLVLPEFNIPEFDGVKMYKKTPNKRDEFERLAKIDQASIRQEVTFIFQKDGYYVVPEQKVLWWNTKTKAVEEAIIAEQTFVVGDGVPSANNDATNANAQKSQLSLPIMQWLIILIIAVFLIAILVALYRHRDAMMQSFDRLNNTQRKQIVSKCLQHVAEQNHKAAMMSLYQLASLIPGNINSLVEHLKASPKQQELLMKLQELAFGSNDKTDLTFSAEDAQQLVAAILKNKKTGAQVKRFTFSMDLNNADNKT
ncbi:BatD family protein [Thalassomonas sp. M1454]|uniref:BatD family protein n=1 Tax=Thalassomonas sp. M1454 TaxID=2594477 RepID=UPI00117F1772|nr:BatD family protein [Thalassomonas sp. M1454]TRX54940.1 protein BatD [Thalassomonas sp. M1454]